MSVRFFFVAWGGPPCPRGTPSSRWLLLSSAERSPNCTSCLELPRVSSLVRKLIALLWPGVCRGGTGAPDRRHQLLRTAQGYREKIQQRLVSERRDADGVEGRYRGPDRQDSGVVLVRVEALCCEGTSVDLFIGMRKKARRTPPSTLRPPAMPRCRRKSWILTRISSPRWHARRRAATPPKMFTAGIR